MNKVLLILLILLLCLPGCFGQGSGSSGVELQDALRTPAEEHLRAADALFGEHKYSEAIESYRSLVREAPDTTWAADAKFNIAYTLSFHENTQKNYSAAFQEFDEFVTQYPENKRVAEAKNLRALLKFLLDTKKDNDRLRRNIEQLKKLDIRHEEQRGR